MKSCRSLKIVYLYVLKNKDKFGSNYEMIVSDLKKIRRLPIPPEFDEEECHGIFAEKDDNILNHLHIVSDFLFYQSDIQEQKYMDLYESLKSIYRIRRKELKLMKKKKSICVLLMEKCFSNFI